MSGKNVNVSEEQLVYAGVLEKGMKLGLIGLFITCAIYMSRVMPATVPVDEISKYWAMPVGDYMHATGLHAGWGWLKNVGKGDFLNFVPISILAGITILCYAAIVPLLLKKNDKVYAIISVLEVLVLLVAASGIIGGGGH